MPAAPKPRAQKKKPRNRLVRVSVLKRSPPPKSRGKSRFPKCRNPEYAAWLRGLPCLLTNRLQRAVCISRDPGSWDATFLHQCDGPVVVAHIQSRGAGGQDVGNTAPLCDGMHKRSHQIGIRSWAVEWFPGGLDELKRIAAETYPAQYQKALALGWPE